MKLRINSILVLSFCFLVTTNILAQTRNNSPYSMYGVGIINDYSSPISFSMGGVGIAFQNQASLNPLNPASIGSLKARTMVFDAGLVMNSSNFSSTEITEKGSYATINHLLFGFQVINHWKTSLGIIPFSDVGYNVNSYESVDNIGEINHIYNGDGGITKAFWTNAFNISKNFTIGIEAGLLFGEIEQSHLMLVDESINYFYTKENRVNNYSDFYFKTGLQYNVSFNEKLDVVFGAIYSTKTNVKTTSLSSLQLVLPPVSGYTNIVETIEENLINGETIIPGVLGFGMMISNKHNLKLGFDFEKQFWSKFLNFENESVFKNSTRLAIGAEYVPDKTSVFSYFKRLSYRAGIRYEKTPLYINANQLSEIGISFGVGLPLKQSLSSINFGIEVGRLGNTSNQLVRETFFRFKLGISMHQLWFEKRKYY